MFNINLNFWQYLFCYLILVFSSENINCINSFHFGCHLCDVIYVCGMNRMFKNLKKRKNSHSNWHFYLFVLMIIIIIIICINNMH